MMTNHMPFLAAFNLSVIYLLLGGGIGVALFLFVSVKVVGNIIFTGEKIEDKTK